MSTPRRWVRSQRQQAAVRPLRYRDLSPAAASRSRGGLRRTAAFRGFAKAGEVAQLAANGHRRPAKPSHSGPRNMLSDGTSSPVCHHPATLGNCLILKQVVNCSNEVQFGFMLRLGPPRRLALAGRAAYSSAGFSLEEARTFEVDLGRIQDDL
jgi:hypothetical protein